MISQFYLRILTPLPYNPSPTIPIEADVKLYKNDSGRAISLKKGESPSIILPSNQFTGYKWVLNKNSLDSNLMKKKSSPHLSGYVSFISTNGSEQWIFEA